MNALERIGQKEMMSGGAREKNESRFAWCNSGKLDRREPLTINVSVT